MDYEERASSFSGHLLSYPSPSSSAMATPPALTPVTPSTPSTRSGLFTSPAASASTTPTADTGVTKTAAPSSRTFEYRNEDPRAFRQQLIPPSPSRSRLDPQYSARLPPQQTQFRPQPTGLPQQQSSGIVPPPGINRDRRNISIFRPAPIRTLQSGELGDGSAVSLSTRNASVSLFETPERPRTCSYSSHSPTPGAFYGRTGYSPSLAHSGSTLGSPDGTPIRQKKRSSFRIDTGYSDRFIPSRATSNLSFSLWDDERGRGRASNSGNITPAGTEGDAGQGSEGGEVGVANQGAVTDGSGARADGSNQQQQQPLLNELLRSELLGENADPAQPPSPSRTATGATRRGSGTPLRDGGNYLRFQSPRQAFHHNVYDDSSGPTSVVNKFNLSPVGSASSHRLLSTPQKRKRRIAKVPFKVLDAPALQDDFYLNLVDWSSLNVLAVGLGSCVYLWSACTSKVTKLCDLAQSEDIVTSVSWTQRGTHLAVGTNRGEVQLWDTTKCKKVRTMGGHSARIGTLSWNGPTLASGSRDRLIYLRDVRIQQPFTARLAAHKQEVCGLKWSFDEPAHLASGGNDNKLLVWDVKNHSQPVNRFADHTAAVKAIAWSPHQHGLLASGGGTADRCIRFWNTLSGTGLSCVDTGSQVCNLAWSQNCNELVSTHGYSLNQIVVWRYPSMSKVATLTGHTYRVLYLAMSPDGSTIVTGAGDETLRFWQVFPGPRSHDKSTGSGLLFPSSPGSVVR